MAKITTTTAKLGKKNSSTSSTMPCNVCHGTGRQKKPYSKKK